MSDPIQEYEETIKFLYSLIDFSLIENLSYSPDKFDLQRVRELLNLMGDPQDSINIIHIAGTKGKGSTAAMIASVLQAAGYRTGFFYSPYLFDFCEQIQINRATISKDELVRQVKTIKRFLPNVEGITTFEATMAAAFNYFKENNVEIAVIEAGLGGKTDATNVVVPLMSVITPISFDHMGVLGNSIESIALNKAGILKTGHPAVVAKQNNANALQIILRDAAEKGISSVRADEEVQITDSSHTFERQYFSVRFRNLERSSNWNGKYGIPLLGNHQAENAATALTSLSMLASMGFKITPAQIKEGLKIVNWPCRFEVINQDPLIILDGAHNVESAKRLMETMEDYFSEKKIILVFGVSIDKDIRGILNVLLPKVEKGIFTKSEHPRAAEPSLLVELGRQYNVPLESAQNVAAAIERAIALADKESVILITGSLFTAAAARQIILKR